MSMPIMKTKLFKEKLLVAERLSPDELRTELEERNENVGPLVGSTLKVYQRKLARMLAEETKSTAKHLEEEEEEMDYSDSDLGEEEEEEEEEEEDEDEPDSHVQAGGDTGPRQRLGTKPVQPATQPQPSKPKSSGLVPLWVQIIALLLLSILIFAIWYNMEEAASMTPKIGKQ